MNKTQLAKAFLAGERGACHNAKTDGKVYMLHGSPIAKHAQGKDGSKWIEFSFCGFYTTTTASHINEILKAAGATHRVSYALARDGKQESESILA